MLGLGLVLGLGGCGRHGNVAAPAASPGRPPPADAPAWTYEIVASPGGAELSVRASFAPGTDPELSVQEGAEPFVRDVEWANASGWTAAPSRGGSWFVPSCAAGCHIRYRVALAAAAREVDDVRVARATPPVPRPASAPPSPQAFASSPSSWLLRPVREWAGEEQGKQGTWFRFHVTVAPGDAFVTGVFPVPGAKDTYEGRTGDRFDLPYAAFGALRVHEILDGQVELGILPGALRNEADVVAWAETSAKTVLGYYGHFPVRRLLVLARPSSGGDGVGFGTTMGIAGAAIAIDVGADATAQDFATDWVLVHEMVHTALPDLVGPHHWLEEGLATYVEPVARAGAGLLGAPRVWAEWVHGMPQGEPARGDRGLDHTRTWGRTYWGGALFCLVADLEIRERTGDKKTLRDALRAIDAASGGIAVAWPIDKVIEVGDFATGVPVLREVYDRMANAPAPVDLEAIWKGLGVVAAADDERSVTFDDNAPLASIRRDWFRAATAAPGAAGEPRSQ